MASAEGDVSAARASSDARAGFWIRFGGSFIDGIVLGIVSTVLRVALKGGTGQALGAAVDLVYFTLLIGGRGQTLGMMMCGIRVISRESGASIGYGRALVRCLVSIVSYVVILLGYLWMLWDGEKQTWHDKAAGSVVVPA